jgi:hypothetical protein
MPLEGNHPDEEEDAVLRIYRQRLSSDSPSSGGDIADLATENPPTLSDTGFPPDADIDLLFHAAVRLVNKGVLQSSNKSESNYGNTYFTLSPQVEISLNGLLCDRCQKHSSLSKLVLHTECANKLRDALTKAI